MLVQGCQLGLCGCADHAVNPECLTLCAAVVSCPVKCQPSLQFGICSIAVHDSTRHACGVQGQKAELQQMYQEWPFFQSTIDLIEMILSKCDMRIAAMYDAQLADTEEEKALGVVLRGKFDDTVKAVLEVKHALNACACDMFVCVRLMLSKLL